MNEEEYQERHLLISKAFRPAGPIDDRTLFAGRSDKMIQVGDAIEQPGQHAAIYGGRGVGKTSLAKIMVKAFNAEEGTGAFHYVSSTTDTFSTIWRSVLEELSLITTRPGLGFGSADRQTIQAAAEFLPEEGDVSVDDVRKVLTVLSTSGRMIFFIDEFEHIHDAVTKTSFADLIKVLSDQLVPVTLALVGVADNIDELVSEHASIRRSLAQIYMQPMSEEELAEIVDKGMAAADLTVESAFKGEVVSLAQGLPNYVHLISQHSAREAVDHDRTEVMFDDLEAGIKRSIENIQQTVLDMYHRATSSNRETLYKEVLLACALAKRDERGTFGAVDVRDQLQQITGTVRDLPAFAQHLNDFSGKGRRGGILDKLGQPHSYRYRFTDPLLQPFVLMRGRIDGRIPLKGQV